jgi:hypothetical protein
MTKICVPIARSGKVIGGGQGVTDLQPCPSGPPLYFRDHSNQQETWSIHIRCLSFVVEGRLQPRSPTSVARGDSNPPDRSGPVTQTLVVQRPLPIWLECKTVSLCTPRRRSCRRAAHPSRPEGVVLLARLLPPCILRLLRPLNPWRRIRLHSTTAQGTRKQTSEAQTPIQFVWGPCPPAPTLMMCESSTTSPLRQSFSSA